jgi:N-acetylglucosaminyldiphosphoundecaprenol N-acetyl-beta-D-mannosaminyltransferase
MTRALSPKVNIVDPVVDDALWERVRSVLAPARPARFGLSTHRSADNRKALNGILFVLKSGIKWEDLPPELGCGSGRACRRGLARWVESGVWPKLEAVLKKDLPDAVQIDWRRARDGPDQSDLEDIINDPVWVWGIPFAPLTKAETVAFVSSLIKGGRPPTFFITANTHYVMLAETNAELRALNRRAAFIVADGAPLVWASRWLRSPLPERVTGSDLIFELSAEAARKGHRVFFLGGAEGVADEAARRLGERYPGLDIAGTASPPFRELSEYEHNALVALIREARADILLTAFTMPNGEKWLAANLGLLGVPVGVNVGAAMDFAAGRFNRAPRWIQKAGLEWAFRLWLEPRRLFGRYARNAWFCLRMVCRDVGKELGVTT